MGLEVSIEQFQKDCRSIAGDNLSKLLGSFFINQDPYLVPFLSNRYAQLFNLDNFIYDETGILPSKAIILDYLADKDLDEKSHDPHKGAFACEFWGGIFFDHIMNNKRLSFTKEDFAYKLQLCYAMLASKTGLYSFAVGAEIGDKILSAFRKTSRDLGITNSNYSSKNVVNLFL